MGRRGAGNRTSVALTTKWVDDTGYHTGALTRRVGVGVGVRLQGDTQGDKQLHVTTGAQICVCNQTWELSHTGKRKGFGVYMLRDFRRSHECYETT